MLLDAGDVIPGDCLLLESNELFVDEATLTGETYPVEKLPGTLPADTPLAKRSNSLFMGTHVVSGSATAVVVHTAKDTEFGQVSERLRLRAAETEFEHGVRRFGYLLLEVTLVLVLVDLRRQRLSCTGRCSTRSSSRMALAVGLTPQLLPAIISINLAHGAKRMAEEKVIVKRLAAIENLGSMNVLCSDKTGTLTEGEVRLHAALDVDGQRQRAGAALRLPQRLLRDRVPEPHRRRHQGLPRARRLRLPAAGRGPLRLPAQAPEPYWWSKDDERFVVTKGTLNNVLEVCTRVECPRPDRQAEAPRRTRASPTSRRPAPRSRRATRL